MIRCNLFNSLSRLVDGPETFVSTKVLAQECGMDLYELMCLMYELKLVTEELFFPSAAALRARLAVEGVWEKGMVSDVLWAPKAQFVVHCEVAKQRAMKAVNKYFI